MTKADYIKNAKLPGIATEVLEVTLPFTLSFPLITLICSAFSTTSSLLPSSLSKTQLISMDSLD